MGGIESYKKTVMRAVSLFNNACGEQIGEQIGGEQITALVCIIQYSICNYTLAKTDTFLPLYFDT